ncbi:GTF2I repeat domain containing 2, partial [Chelydra serpentina]
AKKFEWFSLALDKATDVSNTSQLLLFIRGVGSNFEVMEELASVHSMHGTTTGEEIFKEVEKSLSQYNLQWKQLKCSTTNGGRNMCGSKKGLVGQIYKACESAGCPKPMILHCILHQQTLCGKYLDLSCVMEPVVSTVNFIRSHGLTIVSSKHFCGKVLSRFFELQTEIEMFLHKKTRPLPLLTNSEWLWKLAFYVDLTKHTNDFNLRLQGENGLICDMYTQVKAFRQKLVLFESQLMRRDCFAHFTCCEKFSQETESRFPTRFAQEIISDLKLQFQERFSDLDVNAGEIRIFQNPFDCDVEKLPPELQMEVIYLQYSDLLKDKDKEGNLLEFYKCLPSDQYAHVKNFVRGLMSVFGTTYVCEKTFLMMTYVKSNYRSTLSDEHLQSILMIGNTNFEPQLNAILSEKHQYHASH